MSRVDSAYERIVDVHSTRHSKTVLEEMFRKCGPVTRILHWKGQNDKPHMLVEYNSVMSVNSARCLDRPDLQVIRASNNEGLIRKYKELVTRSKPIFTQPLPKGPRFRSLSPPPPLALRQTRSRRRLPPRDHRLENRWKNDRYHSSESEPESRHESSRIKNPAPASVTVSLGKSVESAGSKDKHAYQATSLTVKEGPVLTQLNFPPNLKAPPIFRIPFAGETIQLDLNNHLEDNPIGIIIMLTAAEASQQLWMIVAAHYNSKRNVESARKVLEAGIDVSIRLGRTDTKPFWFLLDQINKDTHKSRSYNAVGKVPPSNKEAGECSDYNRVSENQEKHPRSPAILSRLSLRPPPEGPRNAVSPVKKSTSTPDMQFQLNKLQDENKALRSKLASLLDDLSEAKAGKRRAEDEAKEERAVRRKLEGDLKHAEDSLRRSKRMEETALEHIKREVESRRKTEALLTNNSNGKVSNSPQPPVQAQPQQEFFHHLKSLLQNVSRLDSASNVPCIP